MIMSVKNETIQFIEYRGKKYTSRSVLSDDIGYDGKTELTLASESLLSDLWCNDENGDLQFIDKEAELLDERNLAISVKMNSLRHTIIFAKLAERYFHKHKTYKNGRHI